MPHVTSTIAIRYNVIRHEGKLSMNVRKVRRNGEKNVKALDKSGRTVDLFGIEDTGQVENTTPS